MAEVLVVLEPDPETDPEDADRLSRSLRAELVELDLAEVRPAPAGTAPEGAKAADPVTLGAAVLALGASGGVFTVLVEALRDWLGRRTGQHRISLTIDGDTIEIDRATDAQQRALVEAYVRRHTSDG
ncbi:effector-associated constant component EACC1 [Actinophytocola xanthii]|uniref:Uncharacterized protein n=1 Tax=Actinophytocola xanthii TaxID=1912961 RepID=A0A1Q8CXY9_9PSEU|nr:hypothetical protein [Actinophytocola xanthii]OLF19224.1 hypothetical protein BU204_02410 [Actinophytocola xanthii]